MYPLNDNKDEMDSILNLLNTGEKNIKFDASYKNTVLVLGNTGAGKSTFTQLIAGDNNNLISKEISQGEYIIIDTNNKISNNSTITSKTIYPELVPYDRTNTAFYDCPGFSDTRSAAHDISATYFIKKVIDSIGNVKFVFIVSYSSVKFGNDRLDFRLLVKHATNLIKNIDKFRNSIALVVSKVNNVYTRKGKTLQLVPDKNIIEGIGNFLKGVKDELIQKDKISDKETIKFIEILLAQSGDVYTKIGIIRSPEEPGRVSDIESLQDGKISLEKLVYENIQSISHDKNDFGYTISSDSKNYIHVLVGGINNLVTQEIQNLGEKIKKYYYDKENQISDIEKFYEILNLGYDKLLELPTAAELIETEEFIKKIIKKVELLNINISGQNLKKIIKYTSYIKFLENFLDQSKSTLTPYKWSKGLKDLIDYLTDSHKWYGFLINLHLRLSDYTIQHDTSRFDITHFENEESINQNDLKQIIDQIIITQDKNIIIEQLKNIKITQLKFNALMNLLDITLNYKVIRKCLPGNKLLLMGEYIKLSDIKKELCPNPIKFIEIFALNKIFIDTNFNGNIQLSIISPIWEIMGSRNITLDGEPGLAHINSKAQDGYSPFIDGKDGKPGLPGGPAGNFLGIGKTFINGQFLRISANGGKGNSGQHGGNGMNGIDGKTPPVNETGMPNDIWKIEGFDFIELSFTSHTILPVGYTTTVFKAFGKKCSRSGNGGNGGIGGKGGSKGNISLIELFEKSNILFETKYGDCGTVGNGGISGSANNGDDLVVGCKSFNTVLGPLSTNNLIISVNNGETISGTNGTTGKNIIEMIILRPPAIFLNRSYTINNYKNYVREKLSDRINESVLLKFLNELENNEGISGFYDTLGLVNEFQGLENQYQNLHKQLLFQSFYKSLLNRIRKYAENPKHHEKSMEYKKVLSYLYAATLSKICSINNSKENNLVIDIHNYLDVVIKNINKLKKSTNLVSINNIQNKYQESINEKIKNAINEIDTQITPEINNIIIQIDQQIVLLSNETVNLITTNEEDQRKLIKQQKALENALVLRKTLGVVKVLSLFLAFIGPVGAVATAAIGASTMVVESLVLDDSSALGTDKILQLPSAIKNSVTRITDQLKNEQQLLKEQLYDAEQALDKFLVDQPSENIREIKQKILVSKTKLKEDIAKGPSASLDTTSTIREELGELLKNQTDILIKQNSGLDIKINKQLRLVNQVQNVVSISETAIDVYSKIRNHQAKIDHMSDAIQKTDDNTKQLRQYQEKIYKNIIPMCSNITNIIKTMEQQLQGKSHVGLDISQWKIQSTLSDFKLIMQKMTKGYKMQEDLTRCIEKLDGGMSIMINVFDRIQDYHDKSELFAYIADIRSSRAMGVTVNNNELNAAIKELDLTIISNLVLGQYETAMNAFKQYVFPFAHFYLADLSLPASLKVDNTTNNFASIAVDQIEHIKSKLSESNAIINKRDTYIHNNIEFSHNSRALPFFVWRHDSNKDTIAKLLDGQKITINADITKGLNKNAIKFNEIGIYFKLANGTSQSELDKELQNVEVYMTHLGNSYYRCGHKLYVMTSDNLTIHYSFHKNSNGHPSITNQVYDKIKNNSFVLSPYTMWMIELYGNFSSLEKFKNLEIDLELKGRGQYVDQGIDVCNENLENYYQVDGSKSEINNINVYNQGSVINANKRRRRHIEIFETSGASSKTSFIMKFFKSLLGLNPINNISKMIFKNHESVEVINNSYMHVDLLSASSTTNQELLTYRLTDKDSTIKHGVDYTGLNTHSNLLLLDLLIRKNNGEKYKVDLIYNVHDEYANDLAYNAYKN